MHYISLDSFIIIYYKLIIVFCFTADPKKTERIIIDKKEQVEISPSRPSDSSFQLTQSSLTGDQLQDESFFDYLSRLMGMISNDKNKRRFQNQLIDQVNDIIDKV